jgi:hypothetical protein
MVVTTMHYELCTAPPQLPTFPHSHFPTFPHIYFYIYIITFMYNNINMCIILPFYDHVHIYMVIKIAFWVHVFIYKIKENNMFREKNKKIN